MGVSIASMFKAASLLNSAKPFFTEHKHSSVGDLIIDATHLEVIEYTAKVTEHPIETKESICDHIFKEPLKIKIEGSVTDSAIRFMGVFEMPLQNNSIEKLTNSLKSFLPFNENAKPSRQAYTILKTYYEARQLVNVVSKLEAFNDMVIEHLTFTNDENTGGRLQFAAELKKIKFAQVKSQLNINTRNKQLQALTAKNVDMGAVEKKQEPANEELRSNLTDIKNGVVKGVNKIRSLYGNH